MDPDILVIIDEYTDYKNEIRKQMKKCFAIIMNSDYFAYSLEFYITYNVPNYIALESKAQSGKKTL